MGLGWVAAWSGGGLGLNWRWAGACSGHGQGGSESPGAGAGGFGGTISLEGRVNAAHETMHIYIYIYVCVYVCAYIYIYVYSAVLTPAGLLAHAPSRTPANPHLPLGRRTSAEATLFLRAVYPSASLTAPTKIFKHGQQLALRTP